MKIKAAGILGLAALVLAVPASAADPSGRFNVRGAGSMRCDAVSAAFAARDTRSVQIVDWLMGYTTAWNRLNQGTFDALPGEDGRDLAGLALALCRSNPTVNLETAASTGLRLLAPLQATRDGPLVSFPVPAPAGAKPGTPAAAPRAIRLHPEAVRIVERKLKALGRYQAAESGTASPALLAALSGFQRAEKLSPTGLPDTPTLIRLMQAR